jgi:hypothetical protein
VRDRHAGPRGGSRFARELGLRDTTYRSYEAGVNPPISVVLSIVERTKVSLLWLLTGASAMDAPEDELLASAVRHAVAELGTACSVPMVQGVAIRYLLERLQLREKEVELLLRERDSVTKKLSEVDRVLPLRAVVECGWDTWEDVLSGRRTFLHVLPELYQADRFIIEVQGLYMEHEIRDGDLCIFDPTEEPYDGAIVAVQDAQDPTKGTVKYYKETKHGIELHPFKPHEPVTRYRLEGKAELYLVASRTKRRYAIKGVLVGLSRGYGPDFRCSPFFR